MHAASKPESSLSAVVAPAVDRRAAVRFGCSHSPLVRAAVRPEFRPVAVIVEDASANGLRLYCEERLKTGVCLAVLWPFGPPECWRTLRARVSRVTARSDGWIAGCVFDQPLQPAELAALLQFDPAAAVGEIDDGTARFDVVCDVPARMPRANNL